jgi:hypothetical protein
MKVYSVSFGRDDEPSQIDRIFLSLESAVAHQRNVESKLAASYWVEVEAHEVLP